MDGEPQAELELSEQGAGQFQSGISGHGPVGVVRGVIPDCETEGLPLDQPAQGALVVHQPPSRRRGGRVPQYRQPERIRERIQIAMVLDTASRICRGVEPGTPAQLMVRLKAAELLMRKSLPDLQTIELIGDGAAQPTLLIITRVI